MGATGDDGRRKASSAIAGSVLFRLCRPKVLPPFWTELFVPALTVVHLFFCLKSAVSALYTLHLILYNDGHGCRRYYSICSSIAACRLYLLEEEVEEEICSDYHTKSPSTPFFMPKRKDDTNPAPLRTS